MAEKRRYSSALRAEQTAIARRRILDTAGALFVEHGYTSTTISAVAAAADVSVQTVYNVVGGKSVLLKAAYDVMLAGDDEPVPMVARPEFRAMIASTDGRDCLARYAAISRRINERVLPLVAMVLAQAAAGDPDLRDFADTIEGERTIGTNGLAGHIAERFGLRPGLDVGSAADIVWTLSSPEITDRLVNRRGWAWDRYEQWLGATMADALFGAGTGH